MEHMTPTDWQNFVDWALKGLIGGVIMYAVHILGRVRMSIESLNKKVATLVERSGWHNKEIDRLHSRLARLEK